MLIFNELIERNATAAGLIGELRLSFEWRQKSRFRTTLTSGNQAGDEVGVRLDRGHVLRDGALLRSDDGSVVRIRAAVESLMHVTADSALGLTRIAYHLGNRHVPVQVGNDESGLWLRLQLDHVLENMVSGLAGRIQVVTEPFDPESGAYGHGHDHAQGHGPGHGNSHLHDGLDGQSYESMNTSGGVAVAGKHDDRRHAPKIHDFL